MTRLFRAPLRTFASARSGDKGNHANIGVVARSDQAFEFLRRTLTEQLVQAYFQGLGVRKVVRYELENVNALNFVLYDVLAGGASESLRIDTQGKLLGTAILDLELSLDDTDRQTLEQGGWQPEENP